MKKIIYLALIGLISLSCSTGDNNIFFDPINGQTLITFPTTNFTLEIQQNSNGTLVVPVDITTVSTSDRTFNAFLDIGASDLDLNPDVLTIGSIMIPANSFQGTLTITGEDLDLDTTPDTAVIGVVEENGVVTDDAIAVEVTLVCPVEETLFTGAYLLEAVEQELLFGSVILTPGMVFDVTADGLSRTFTTRDFVNFCAPTVVTEFSINLVCDQTIVPVQDTSCNCGTNNSYENGNVGGAYDLNDDSEWTFQFIRNCGTGAAQNLYRFVRQ